MKKLHIAFFTADWNYELVESTLQGLKQYTEEHENVKLYVFDCFGKDQNTAHDDPAEEVGQVNQGLGRAPEGGGAHLVEQDGHGDGDDQMQDDLPEGDDDGVLQRGNGAGQVIQINKVIPAHPFLVAEQPLGGHEFLERDDQSAQRNVHINEDQDHRRQQHQCFFLCRRSYIH